MISESYGTSVTAFNNVISLMRHLCHQNSGGVGTKTRGLEPLSPIARVTTGYLYVLIFDMELL